MSTQSFTIMGNDFDRAGLASHRLKEQLKRIGVEPQIIRRAIIAAYEAEMNVVIYAKKGNMFFKLTDSKIDIEVIDEGPGIPDIEKAMQAGYSTAPEKIREMGFGAGLGLPNIKKASDFFEIHSTSGKGTQVHFIINLTRLQGFSQERNSVLITAELCNQCAKCLQSCPTYAFRIHKEKPEILAHLCIDCAECIRKCQTGALSIDIRNKIPVLGPVLKQETLLVLPEPFLFQFGSGIDASGVIESLKQLGFSTVYGFEAWEEAIRKAVEDYYYEDECQHPVISPLCPPVLNLIKIRFPSLIAQVAPFCTPVEAAWEQLYSKNAIFSPACPGQHTALTSDKPSSEDKTISLSALFEAVFPLLRNKTSRECKNAGKRENRPSGSYQTLQVTGISNVINVLEKTENGFLGDFNILELFACEQGCFGSPLFREDPYIARQRWLNSPVRLGVPQSVNALKRDTPLKARRGLRLDEDMHRAIQKLSSIDKINRALPGKDCGLCGAPTCACFAEDVVLGRAVKSECIFLSGQEDNNNEHV